jgi:hypothetical protein
VYFASAAYITGSTFIIDEKHLDRIRCSVPG